MKNTAALLRMFVAVVLSLSAGALAQGTQNTAGDEAGVNGGAAREWGRDG